MPSATTDMAFSQSMWSALSAIQKEMGGESALVLKYSENMYKVPDAAAAIRDYASQGFDIVIAHGSQYGSSVQEIATDFPDVTFAWGTDVNTFGLPNVYAYTAAAEQGGYVNGVLAAKLTKSQEDRRDRPRRGRRCEDLHRRLRPGRRSPSIQASIVSKTWTGSFSDVALMAAAAKTHIANGADVLTGSSQSVVGSIGAAKDCGEVLWFGTQADQAALAPEARGRKPGIRLDGNAQGHHLPAQERRSGRGHLHPDPGQRRLEGRLQPGLSAFRGREGCRRTRQSRESPMARSRWNRRQGSPRCAEHMEVRKARHRQGCLIMPLSALAGRGALRRPYDEATRAITSHSFDRSASRCATSSSASPECAPTPRSAST